MKFSRILLVMVAAFALLFAAGCGGGGSDDPAPSGEAQDKIIIGSDAAYPPLEWQDTATGELVGYDIDVIKAVMEEAGLEYEIRNMAWDALIPSLTSNQIDVVISAMTIKPSRAESVDFTDPYYKSGLIVAVHKNNEDIHSFDDLAGKNIGVQIGTTGADKAEEIKAANPGTEVVAYDRIPEAFMALRNGNVDAVVNDAPVAYYFIEQDTRDDFKVVGDLLSSEYYGIAMAKDNAELYDAVNGALKALKENGKLQEIHDEWFGEFGEMPEELLTITVQDALDAWEGDE